MAKVPVDYDPFVARVRRYGAQVHSTEETEKPTGAPKAPDGDASLALVLAETLKAILELSQHIKVYTRAVDSVQIDTQVELAKANENLEKLAKTITAPKEVVFNAEGRPVGIKTKS